MNQLKKIYLIDDDEGINFLNKAIITRLELANEVMAFNDPLKALETLKAEFSDEVAPELIFLDINMPLMDGWEFVDELEKISEAKEVVVIMLSSSIDPSDKAKARSIPMIRDFHSKPLSFDMAKSIVKEYF